MTDDWGRVLTPEDITDEFAEEFYDTCISGWFEESRIDWPEAIERWERYHEARETGAEQDVTFGPAEQAPAEMRLRRKVRAIRAEAGY